MGTGKSTDTRKSLHKTEIIKRGTNAFRFSLYRHMNDFLYSYSCCFKRNRTAYKLKKVDSILNKFDINYSFTKNLKSIFKAVLNDIDETKAEYLNTNIKYLPITLANHKKLGVSLIIEFCSMHYKITYMNFTKKEADDKFIKIYRYQKLDMDLEKEPIEKPLDLSRIHKSIIEHLECCIADFLKKINTDSVTLLPVILMKSDENSKRSYSIDSVIRNSTPPRLSVQDSSIQQIIENFVDTEEFPQTLQTHLDGQPEESGDEKVGFLQNLLSTDSDENTSSSSNLIKPKLIVFKALGVSMASFLATYFYDNQCKLSVSLSNELKFCYYNEKIQKLVCINFDKLFEICRNKQFDSDLPNIDSFLTIYDKELACTIDGPQFFAHGMIGILNQCELVRLVLVDLMMKGFLFENDYKFKHDELKSSMSEIPKDDFEGLKMKPILVKKIIKKNNANIKLHIKYCLHAKFYSEIENDDSCRLVGVEKVLKNLGFRHTSYFDRFVTKLICQALTKRSAKIISSLIRAFFKHFDMKGKTNVCIALDGMMFKFRPKFNSYLEFYLNEQMNETMKYYLKISRLEYSIGAAYAALVVLETKLKDDILKSYRENLNYITEKRKIFE
jgi:hypothetical protein